MSQNQIYLIHIQNIMVGAPQVMKTSSGSIYNFLVADHPSFIQRYIIRYLTHFHSSGYIFSFFRKVFLFYFMVQIFCVSWWVGATATLYIREGQDTPSFVQRYIIRYLTYLHSSGYIILQENDAAHDAKEHRLVKNH